jgi:hypothetical protein
VDSQSDLTLAIAIIGAATGVLGLIIALAAFWRDKAKLRLTALFRRDSPDSSQELIVEVANNGRQPETLTLCLVLIRGSDNVTRIARVLLTLAAWHLWTSLAFWLLRVQAGRMGLGRAIRRGEGLTFKDWQRPLDVWKGSSPIRLAPGELWWSEVSDFEAKARDLAKEQSFSGDLLMAALVVDARENLHFAVFPRLSIEAEPTP